MEQLKVTRYAFGLLTPLLMYTHCNDTFCYNFLKVDGCILMVYPHKAILSSTYVRQSRHTRNYFPSWMFKSQYFLFSPVIQEEIQTLQLV